MVNVRPPFAVEGSGYSCGKHRLPVPVKRAVIIMCVCVDHNKPPSLCCLYHITQEVRMQKADEIAVKYADFLLTSMFP